MKKRRPSFSTQRKEKNGDPKIRKKDEDPALTGKMAHEGPCTLFHKGKIGRSMRGGKTKKQRRSPGGRGGKIPLQG